MVKRNVVKKKATKKRVGGGRKTAVGSRKMRTDKKPPGRKKRKPGRPRGVQPRVWRRAARLAQDARIALDAGNLAQVREYLQSIQAVAECADRS